MAAVLRTEELTKIYGKDGQSVLAVDRSPLKWSAGSSSPW